MNSLEDRLAAVHRVLSDPPQVHVPGDGFVPPHGVWGTDIDCYQFLAQHANPAARTLETGLGISTVLFAVWGCEHTCVVGSQDEVDRCISHLESRAIDTSKVTFEVGPSEQVLPSMSSRELDLVFLDGGHGFPTPIIDWFYAGSLLRKGGVLVLDDLQLEHVRLGLVEFIERDDRWTSLDRTPKWGAWERREDGRLGEDWYVQTFLSNSDPSPMSRLKNKLAGILRRP